MYRATILADSVDPRGNRLTTFELVFPRIILSQFSKHRMFSFNTSSSRAIPFEKMIKSIEENPFIPIAWQKDHKGMQGTEYFTDVDDIKEKEMYWLTARSSAVNMAQKLNNHNTTKQLCNRLLEPFMWVKVIMTTSEEGLQNFFELRCSEYKFKGSDSFKSKVDCIAWYPETEHFTELERLGINTSQADIHIQKLAEMMWDTYNESTPEELSSGMWHIPFRDKMKLSILEQQEISQKFPKISSKDDLAVRIASALAARVSYTTIGSDFNIDYEKLLKLHDRLVEDRHLSCFEHCARVMDENEYYDFVKGVAIDYEDGNRIFLESSFGWCNNLKGFISYRYMIENGKNYEYF